MKTAPKNYIYNPTLNPRTQTQEWLEARRLALHNMGRFGTPAQQRSPGRLAELAIIDADLLRRRRRAKVLALQQPPGPYSAVLQAVCRP